MNSRLIVILNDNDMSIAPPVGAMSALSRAPRLGPHLSRRCARSACSLPHKLPKVFEQKALQRRGIRARLPDRRHAVRGARLLLRRPDRRPQPRPPSAGAEERARRQAGPDPGPRRDAEGQGLRAGRSVRRQVSWRREVRRRHRRAGEGEVERPAVHQGVRREPDQGSAARTTRSSRSPPRCRPAPASICSARNSRSAPSTSASPSSMRVTFAAGLATEGYKPFCAIYSTFLQRGYDQVVHDVAIQKPAGAFRDGPRRPRRRRRPDACGLVRRRVSRLPARLRADGGGGRGRTRSHGGDAGRDRRPPVGAALSARRGRRRRDAGRRHAARDRQGPHRPRGPQGRAALLRHAPRRMPQGGGRTRARSASRPRSRTRASPSRSTSISSRASRASTRC